MYIDFCNLSEFNLSDCSFVVLLGLVVELAREVANEVIWLAE